ncbi:MAG TPA: hypothetical protein VGI39_16780 [Polyangiaceae bacterium]
MWRAGHDGTVCPTLEQLENDKELEKATEVTDAWGTPFRIRCAEDDTFVTSLGPDRRPSADDIVVPEPETTKQGVP